MNVSAFLQAVRPLVGARRLQRVADTLLRRLHVRGPHRDPCRDIQGMASPRKLRLLSTAVSFLPASPQECYLEIGTYQGKSLVAALMNNPGRHAVACDNFSLFDQPEAPTNKAVLEQHLARYGLSNRVRFFDCDFRELLSRWIELRLPPVGVYFYDGAHDQASQYLAIVLAEPVLADHAIVVVDDWRLAEDSHSFAEAGTRQAVGESRNEWKLEHVLPARYNGDVEEWWNGVAVLSFRRRRPSA